MLYRYARLLPALLLTTAVTASAQSWQWARGAGATISVLPNASATDPQGNTYVTGIFEGVAQFGPITLTTTSATSASYNDRDMFLAKYDPQGTVLWAVRAGSTGRNQGDSGEALDVDAQGNVLVVGIATANASFGTIQPASPTPVPTGFAARYNAAGVAQWAVRLAVGGGGTVFAATAASFDPAGRCRVVNGNGELLTLDGSTGQVLSTLATTNLVTSLNTVRRGTDASGNTLLAVVVYNSANSATLGTTSLTNNGGVLAKVSSIGAVVWARQLTTGSFKNATSDASGIVYAVIEVFSTATSLDGIALAANSISIAKLSASGQLLWARNVRPWGSIRDILVDGTGNYYLTGVYDRSTGPVPAGGPALPNANYDGFVAKFNDAGQPQWALTLGSGTSNSGFDQSTSLSRDAAGILYVTGFFARPSAAFGTAITLAATGTSTTPFDTFIARINGAGLAPLVTHGPRAVPAALLWPNPAVAGGEVQVALPAGEQATWQVTLTDALGRTVSLTQTLPTGPGPVRLALGNVTPGLYLLTCRNGQQQRQARVVVQ